MRKTLKLENICLFFIQIENVSFFVVLIFDVRFTGANSAAMPHGARDAIARYFHSNCNVGHGLVHVGESRSADALQLQSRGVAGIQAIARG